MGDAVGAMVGVAGEDRGLLARGGGFVRRELISGLSLDLLGEGSGLGSLLLWGEVGPAGKRREVERVLGVELGGVGGAAASAGLVLGARIMPRAREGLALGEGAGGVDAGPVGAALDELLLDAVREVVSEPVDGGLLAL